MLAKSHKGLSYPEATCRLRAARYVPTTATSLLLYVTRNIDFLVSQ